MRLLIGRVNGEDIYSTHRFYNTQYINEIEFRHAMDWKDSHWRRHRELYDFYTGITTEDMLGNQEHKDNIIRTIFEGQRGWPTWLYKFLCYISGYPHGLDE